MGGIKGKVVLNNTRIWSGNSDVKDVKARDIRQGEQANRGLKQTLKYTEAFKV